MHTLPTAMRAIAIHAPEPEGLVPETVAVPKPTGRQVLIRVHAAGVNRPDVMQRKGLYPPPAGASAIPGLEVAGEIVAVGDDVTARVVGQWVCALVTGGGYAEYCVAAAACCLPIPVGLTAIQAAALPETFFTVWSNVFDLGRLSPDETLLVHGGGSGIGTTAIQLAKAFGSRVIVTAGSNDKCQACLALGADLAINYKESDFVELVKADSQWRGVDVILDMIGGDYFPRNLQCLATEGRLLQIAVQSGIKAEINLLTVMLKRLTISGSTLRSRDDTFKGNIARQLQEKVWPLLAEGRIRPIIDSSFTLSDASQAHRLLESSRHVGKIVLTI